MAIKEVNQGDLIFFGRLTLHRAWQAQGWRGLLGWWSNSWIAFWQWLVSRDKQGFHNLIHVGIVLVHGPNPVLCEFTFGQTGTGNIWLRDRVSQYPGEVWHFPLSNETRRKLDNAKLNDFIHDVRFCTYNCWGLQYAISKLRKGQPIPGKLFCSEMAVAALQAAGVLPACIQGMGRFGGMPVPVPVGPHEYNPAELAGISKIYDNSAIGVLTKESFDGG